MLKPHFWNIFVLKSIQVCGEGDMGAVPGLFGPRILQMYCSGMPRLTPREVAWGYPHLLVVWSHQFTKYLGQEGVFTLPFLRGFCPRLARYGKREA